MPRAIPMDMTLDDVRREIIFTQVALEADDDAKPLKPLTDKWMPALDEVGKLDLAFTYKSETADAHRSVGNHHLDGGCIELGRDLDHELKGDHKHPRWLMFFIIPVSDFVRRAFATQVALVRGWLTGIKDPIMEKHRPALEKWTKRCEDALVETNALAGGRGELWQKRRDLAEGLTRERDGLHAELVKVGNAKKLDRDWPNIFFRIEHRPERPAAPPPAGTT